MLLRIHCCLYSPSSYVEGMTDDAKAPLGSKTLVVFGVALGVAGLLAGADRILADVENRERKVDAKKLYTQAQNLQSSGQYQAALDLYRQARNKHRANIDYQVALIQSLQQIGETSEAEAEGRRLLEEQPSSGPVNLVMARLLASEKQYTEAAWFYRRALYGNWGPSSNPGLESVRLELAE